MRVTADENCLLGWRQGAAMSRAEGEATEVYGEHI